MTENYEKDHAWDFGCDGDCDSCGSYDVCHENDEEFEEEDSGFLGSFMEAQLVRDGQVICEKCSKKVSSILDDKNPNPCNAQSHKDFKALFDVRCAIGLHDLQTRGWD